MGFVFTFTDNVGIYSFLSLISSVCLFAEAIFTVFTEPSILPLLMHLAVTLLHFTPPLAHWMCTQLYYSDADEGENGIAWYLKPD